MVPPSRPAMPVGVSTNRPWPSVTLTPADGGAEGDLDVVREDPGGARGGVPAGAPGLTAPVTCSNPKTPDTDWPAMVMVARLAAVPSCRRIDPAAMS